MEQLHIHNVPDYAKTKRCLLVKTVQGEIWFHGAYDNYNQAVAHMTELNQEDDRHFVIPNPFLDENKAE